MGVEVSGQYLGVISPFPSCGFQGLAASTILHYTISVVLFELLSIAQAASELAVTLLTLQSGMIGVNSLPWLLY